jgi:hypothetical protein
MRKKAEVEKAQQASFDLLWYVRHKKRGVPEGTPQDIIDAAEEAAKRIEQNADPEYLQMLLTDRVGYGMLLGRISTLRWLGGMEWDQSGILDT